MKVAPEMYGRRAKCIACHQKWFIPEGAEITPQTKVLYLKEHPELMRHPGQKTRSRPTPPILLSEDGLVIPEAGENDEFDFKAEDNAQVSGFDEVPPEPEPKVAPPANESAAVAKAEMPQSSDGQEIQLPDDADSKPAEAPPAAPAPAKPGPVPLDILEPLKLLSNYQAELARRKAGIEGLSGASGERAVLDAYARTFRKLRDRLNASLDSRQKATRERLTAVEDKLAQWTVSLRVGDATLKDFTARTAKLRAQREVYERYLVNLIAWREVDAPHAAGGVMELPLESFDETNFSLRIPSPPQTLHPKPLFLAYCEELRETMNMRAAIERRKAEWKRLAAEDAFPREAIEEGVAETQGVLYRIRARIRFCRTRLKYLLTDCENDTKAIECYTQEAFERMKRAPDQERMPDAALREAHAAEEEIARIRKIIRQALSANSAGEVPSVAGATSRPTRGAPPLPVDMAFRSLSAPFLLAGLLILAGYGTTRVNWPALLLGLLIVAQLSLGFVLDAKRRHRVDFVVWAIHLPLLMCALYYRAAFDPDPLSPVWRGPVFDVMGLLLVCGAILSGAVVGLIVSNRAGEKGVNTMFTVAVICAFAAFSGITVAVLHTVMPRLALSSPAAVADVGHGGTFAPFPVIDTLPAPPPRVTPAPNNVLPDLNNETAETTEQLEQPNSREPAAGQEGESFMVEFSLHGVMHGEGAAPLFRASLVFPDGHRERHSFKLNDPIVGAWTMSEYNVAAKKLTISNGERLLVLGAGDQEMLDPRIPGETVGGQGPQDR